MCIFYKEKQFFDFEGFREPADRDTDPNLLVRFLKNFVRNMRATGVYFLAGILLSALFQRYVPSEFVEHLFGGDGRFGIFMAATIGVPLYACGGGTIPLLQTWMYEGMGSAAAFMLTGPATKITNLGAVKIVLGMKRFLLYLAFIMVYAFLSGICGRWQFVRQRLKRNLKIKVGKSNYLMKSPMKRGLEIPRVLKS